VEVSDYIDLKLVHEIHTSERRSFRACRRRWDWLFNQSYYPKTTAKPLEFGVAYHKAMETYYDPKTWKWDREVIGKQAILDFIAVCEEQRLNALQQTGQIDLQPDTQQDYDERVELGKGMLNYYFLHVAPKEDRGWVPVKVEIAFMIPIPNPETGEDTIWCKCDNCKEKWVKHLNALTPDKSDYEKADSLLNWQGLPVVYAGRLDMLAQDAHGNYWIFDWKTCRNIATDYEFLYLDDQVGSYPWALKKVGINVRGFVYHEQRKGFPKPPQKNKVRRLGCHYSVSKSQETSYDMFLETIMEDDREAYEAGHYDDFLEYLKADQIIFHMRHQIIKTDAELDEIEKNIGYEALDMIDPNLRIYPSAGRFGCGFCAFRQPCLEQNNQGDVLFTLEHLFEKREHYYVRQEASTESKGGE
jgi:hypothetical protein